jgi:large subunit ribosomal protein L29
MKPADLRQLTIDELNARIRQLREELFGTGIKHATGQLENTAGLRMTRHELARALTVQRERARAE